MSIPPAPPSSAADIGILGEDFVASWLQAQGWTILHRRWRCRWGELDIIAQQVDKGDARNIVFVEVKTRSQRNWDADGREAIAPKKQAKLWMAATAFLAAYPEFAEYPCRFDVACVGYQRRSRQPSNDAIANDIISDNWVQIAGYRLFLRDYIHSAFDS